MTGEQADLGATLQCVAVERIGEAVAVVTISRPKALNALDSATLDEVAEAVRRCDEDESVRVVLLRGSGDKAFSAGGDIKHMSNMSPRQFYDYNMRFARTIRTITNAGVPIIAVVQGYAFGGGWSLCQAADLVVASERASFGMQEIEVGLFGGAEFFAAIVGKHRAAEILLVGERMTAAVAKNLGLVNIVVPHEDLNATALQWAERLAQKPSTAMRLAKKVLRMSLTLSPQEIGELQAPMMALCFDTDEQREAMARVGKR